MNDAATLRALAEIKARELWATFTANEKSLVRFGMFPAKQMTAATADGHDSRLLAVALCDCAANDGGMRA